MTKRKSNAFYEGYEAGMRLDRTYYNPFSERDPKYTDFFKGYLMARKKYIVQKTASSPKIARYLSKDFE